jgi:hypothetical protein
VVHRSKLLSQKGNSPERRRSHFVRFHASEEKRMHDKDRQERKRMIEVLTGRALLLLFGLGVLGFLVAIDRADWVSMRPATGTSIAIARASDAGQASIDNESSIHQP